MGARPIARRLAGLAVAAGVLGVVPVDISSGRIPAAAAHTITSVTYEGDQAMAVVDVRYRESASFRATHDRRVQSGRLQSSDPLVTVTHYSIKHNHPKGTGHGQGLPWLRRLATRHVAEAAQLQGICNLEDCEGTSDLYQYQFLDDSDQEFTTGLSMDLSQETIGEDVGGEYDDLFGGVVEICVEVTEVNGWAEGLLCDEDAPDENVQVTLYDAEGETEVPTEVLWTNGARAWANLTGWVMTRVQDFREFNGIPCWDVPAVYWEVFENSALVGLAGFLGTGIGALKGCLPANAATPKAYVLCVGGAAGFGAMTGGSITFGVQLYQVWKACEKELLLLPAEQGSEPPQVREPMDPDLTKR